jgi:uncharacterized protein YecA (UPF0149 family)
MRRQRVSGKSPEMFLEQPEIRKLLKSAALASDKPEDELKDKLLAVMKAPPPELPKIIQAGVSGGKLCFRTTEDRARRTVAPLRRANLLGRNDRCYCGSGKKLKHCCGGARGPH